jgi:hypothetical protein
MSNSHQLAVKQTSALALPPELAAELALEAKDAAAKERPSVGRISLKSGMMTYQGQAIPGNKMDVVILTSAHRNVWYAGQYDANNIVNPNCFALGEDEDSMAPHANVAEPCAVTCATCPKNEWGSDPRPNSRGKACKQTRRLVLMPANVLTSPDEVLKAELALLDLPVTSVRNYASFVNVLNATAGLPAWAAVTSVSVQPNAKTQFQVNFTPLSAVPAEMIEALRKRREDANRLALTPYEGSGGENDPEAGKTAAPAKLPIKKKF